MIRTPSLFGLQRIISRLTGAGSLSLAGAMASDQTQTFQARTGTIALVENTLGTLRNLVPNGACIIDQRVTQTTPVVPVSSGGRKYGPDIWSSEIVGTMVSSLGRVVDAPPAVGAIYSVRTAITTLQASLSAGHVFVSHEVFVIGQDFAQALWGTSAARTVYVDFWIKAYKTGTYSVSARNSANNRSYVKDVVIAAAATWQRVQISFPGDQAGTWLTDNGVGLYLSFCGGAGSGYQTTQNFWAVGNFTGTASTTNFADTVSATGVQIADLSVTLDSFSDFQRVPYSLELIRCLPYLPSIPPVTTTSYLGNGINASATQSGMCIPLSPNPRVPVTGVIVTGTFKANEVTGSVVATSVTYSGSSASTVLLNINVAAGLTVNRPTFLEQSSGASMLFTGAEP